MGHLTLISEDVINALEHYPPDLKLSIAQYAPQPAWDEYVTGRYNETKKKDTSLLGGGKPIVASANRTGGRWKVDEEDSVTSTPPMGSINNGTNGIGEIKSEFRRAGSVRLICESTADFGPPDVEDEDEKASAGPPQVSDRFGLIIFCDSIITFQFARYLAQEMHSSDQFGSSDASDDEEEDGGWLTHSSFTLKDPPSIRHRSSEQKLFASSGFDVSILVVFLVWFTNNAHELGCL